MYPEGDLPCDLRKIQLSENLLLFDRESCMNIQESPKTKQKDYSEILVECSSLNSIIFFLPRTTEVKFKENY